MPLSDTLHLRAIRGFHVGGSLQALHGQAVRTLQTVPGLPARASDPNGHCASGQLYVQHFQQAQPGYPWPLYLWHGGGMTGCTWEQTPDGRPGWHDYFMRQGYDTLVSDAVERGRASWPPQALAEAGPPEARTLEQTWDLFRLGQCQPDGQWRAHAGLQFPCEALPQLLKQFVPRWTAHREQAIAAYIALLEQTGPGIVIAHSEGGRLAQTVAQARPDLIRALVLVEPAGGLAPAPEQAAALRTVPICVVWGDFFETSPLWRRYRQACEHWLQALRQAGVRADTLDLPAQGVSGNSHLPMMDRNNLQVADLVQAWIRQATA